MFEKQNIHFVGIGGIGMSAIAEVLHRKGFTVSGSDLKENSITARLRKKGIKIFKKHSSNNIKKVGIIVHSSAIKKSNIEIKTAKKKKIPIYTRAMMLSEVMRLKPSITIAGSHGKTTTTSLIASILEFAGFDPTIINGGIINDINTNAKLGSGEWIVAEADESDGSFTMLPSTIGVINNIDLEHLDYYRNIEEIKTSFVEYSKNIPFYGFLSINIDDSNVRSILKKIEKKKIFTYGFSKNANFSASKVRIIKRKNNFFSCFNIIENLKNKRTIKNVLIPLLGDHNIINALSAYSIARGLKVPDSKILNSLKNFKGVKRRFSIIYNNYGNLVIDDYAHHPEEIKTTLNALKSVTKKKLITIFEPHRYSRVRGMKQDFLKCFNVADMIFILPIYTAGEKIDNKISNVSLSKSLNKKYKNKIIQPATDNIKFFKDLYKIISSGDNIIFLGAGNSSKIANAFSEFLRNHEI
jgi:UDP-N-acetylmuramate--alanine ligase